MTVREFLHWLGHPLRAVVSALTVLVNLTRQQMRALFSLAMIGGMISLSGQNFIYTYFARRAVARGEAYRPLFDLIQEQMRFNSALVAWFAVILGLIVFGADWLRAKWGDRELQFGKDDPASIKDDGE
ncbi:hypothetical protein [Novosphingobium pentaromativorans]|uniref:Uncharacterized protein n=1 Tax=Novosphingobium pentaromativorans US6-1 TaxID=1088721 RepID=G6E8V9_9SPHN|nr:hypothetical protein [Novosphingobium pentaromativorans]AIT81210.1 hypothetical protein JI59_16190 [Novosphingobium pentaromativorans US6-1]EHJ62183.1 hypothetical protein NSU_0780 [Novosphingobium pentaromativorans US6-1]